MNEAKPSSCRTVALAFFIFVAIVGLYFPVRSFEFINLDDPQYVTKQPHVQAGFTKESLAWAFTESEIGHYHPLTRLSHMLDYQLFGANAGGHHLVNVLFHALNAALFFILLIRVFPPGQKWLVETAFFCAMLFGVHPLRLESVAWVSERKDVLSVFFSILVLHSYTSFVRTRSVRSYSALLTVFVLGLLSKPMVVTLPVLLLVFDFWPLRRMVVEDSQLPPAKFRALFLEKVPLLVLAFVFSLVSFAAQMASGGVRSLSQTPIADRVAVGLTSTLAYAGKLFWPTGFGIFYPYQVLAPGIGAGSALGLLAVTAWCVTLRRDRPYLLFGWLWFVIAVLPICGLVQIGGQIFADRWTYLPHLGLIVGSVVAIVEILSRRVSGSFMVLAATIILGLAAFITRIELPNWSNSERLFLHTLVVSRDNFLAHTNLSVVYIERNDLVRGEEHAREAVRLNRRYPEALNDLGTVLGIKGEVIEAQKLFRQALELRPNFLVARYNLGLISSNLGDDVRALNEWFEVLTVDPNYNDALNSIDFTFKNRLPRDCSVFSPQRGMNDPEIIGKLRQNATILLKQEATPSIRVYLEHLKSCL